jgi:hypothetical protein
MTKGISVRSHLYHHTRKDTSELIGITMRNSHRRCVWRGIVLVGWRHTAAAQKSEKGGSQADQVDLNYIAQIGTSGKTQDHRVLIGGCQQAGGSGQAEEEGTTDSGWVLQEGLVSRHGASQPCSVDLSICLLCRDESCLFARTFRDATA